MVEAPFLFLSCPYPHPFLGFHLPSSSWKTDLLPPNCLPFSSGLEPPSHPFSPLAGFSVHLHLTCWCPCEPLVQMVLTFPEITLFDLLFFAHPVWDALALHVEEAQGALALPSLTVLAFCHPPSWLVRAFSPLLSWKALAVWPPPFLGVLPFFLPPSWEAQAFCLLPFGEAQPFDCRPSLGAHSFFLHLFWTTQDALLLLSEEEVLVVFRLLFLKSPASFPPLAGSVQLASNLLSPPPSSLAVALGHGLPGGVGARGPVVSRLQELSLMAQMAAAWHQSRP